MALSCDKYGLSKYKAEYSLQDLQQGYRLAGLLLSVIFHYKEHPSTFSTNSYMCVHTLSDSVHNSHIVAVHGPNSHREQMC